MAIKKPEADEAAAEASTEADADLEHPALDNAARPSSGGIDLNDPTLTDQEAVEQALAAQNK